MSDTTANIPLTVRLAGTRDADELRRLAQLDSASVPAGDVLVAEREGRVLAALPLDGSRAIADPFERTIAVVELLELRAAQIRDARAAQAPSFLRRLEALFERPAVRVN